MSNKSAIKFIHNIKSVDDLRYLPAVPACDGSDIMNHAIYAEVGFDHSVVLYQNELSFSPQIFLSYKDLHYLDEAYCYQYTCFIFNLDQLRVFYDIDLTFLMTDPDEPDESIELYHKKEYSKDFKDIESMLYFLKNFFGKRGFKKYLLKPANLTNIFRKLENEYYSKQQQAA